MKNREEYGPLRKTQRDNTKGFLYALGGTLLVSTNYITAKYGLRASVWSEDNNVTESFVQKVDTGGVMVNDDHLLFTSRLPHLGGVKASGIIGSKYFNLELTYMKYVHRGKPRDGSGE